MSDNDGGSSRARLGGMASGGADMLRRAFSVAAREEMNQAREETMERLSPAARSAAMMLGGGIVAAYGATYLLQAVVQLLSTRMPRWLALLLPGGMLTLVGAVLLESGRRRLKNSSVAPQDDDRQP